MFPENIFSNTIFQTKKSKMFSQKKKQKHFSKGSLYPLVGKSGAPSCREGLRTGPETSPESSAGARAMAVLCGNPPAWVCVRHAPRTARRRLDCVRSNYVLFFVADIRVCCGGAFLLGRTVFRGRRTKLSFPYQGNKEHVFLSIEPAKGRRVGNMFFVPYCVRSYKHMGTLTTDGNCLGPEIKMRAIAVNGLARPLRKKIFQNPLVTATAKRI